MNKKGFTIIEVIVAVFILAVGIVAVLNMFPLGIQMARSSQMASVAVHLGQEKIEEMLSDTYNNLIEGTATEEYGSIPGFEGHKRKTNINCVNYENLLEVSCDYDLTNDPEPLKKIEVEVFWRSSLVAAEKSINLVGLITKR